MLRRRPSGFSSQNYRIQQRRSWVKNFSRAQPLSPPWHPQLLVCSGWRQFEPEVFDDSFGWSPDWLIPMSGWLMTSYLFESRLLILQEFDDAKEKTAGKSVGTKRPGIRGVGVEKPMPREIRPMMAQSAAQPFDHSDWIFEMKWDGYRALATIGSGHVNLWSRNGLRLDSKYPHIVQELKRLKLKSAVLDGEIVALDAEGIPRFGLLQRFQRDRSGTLMYLVFDLLYLNGEDLMDLPLVRRREILKKLLPKQGSIRFSDAIEGRGIEFFRAARERGLEGIMAKRKGSQYLPGRRSENWLKIKARMQQEAVIGGITEPGGGRHYFGALMLGLYDQGRLQYVGHTGTGFSEALLKDLFGKLTPYFTDRCPFAPKPKANAPVKWVEPRFVCEVAFQEWTSDGKMRAPSFLGLRDDKDPKEVVREN